MNFDFGAHSVFPHKRRDHLAQGVHDMPVGDVRGYDHPLGKEAVLKDREEQKNEFPDVKKCKNNKNII